MGAVRFPKRLPEPPESPQIRICAVLKKKYYEVRDTEAKHAILEALKKNGCTEELLDILEEEKDPGLIKYIASLLE